MGDKEKFLYHTNQARLAHKHWVGMIKLLVSDLLKNKSDILLNITQIEFGKWLYEEASLFKNGNCSTVLDEIETLWEEIYEHFMQIYEICVQNRKKNIFGVDKALNQSERQLASHHYQELVTLTDRLQSRLRMLEKQLQAKSEKEFFVYDSFLKHKELSDSEKNKKENEEKKSSIDRVSGARGAYFYN